MQLTGTSISDTIAPIAATDDKRKNKNIKKLPINMVLKICGMVMNNNDGPELGANPNENTAGKMAIPANIETVKSAIIIV